jgi:colicin import membrane protein
MATKVETFVSRSVISAALLLAVSAVPPVHAFSVGYVASNTGLRRPVALWVQRADGSHDESISRGNLPLLSRSVAYSGSAAAMVTATLIGSLAMEPAWAAKQAPTEAQVYTSIIKKTTAGKPGSTPAVPLKTAAAPAPATVTSTAALPKKALAVVKESNVPAEKKALSIAELDLELAAEQLALVKGQVKEASKVASSTQKVAKNAEATQKTTKKAYIAANDKYSQIKKDKKANSVTKQTQQSKVSSLKSQVELASQEAKSASTAARESAKALDKLLRAQDKATLYKAKCEANVATAKAAVKNYEVKQKELAKKRAADEKARQKAAAAKAKKDAEAAKKRAKAAAETAKKVAAAKKKQLAADEKKLAAAEKARKAALAKEAQKQKEVAEIAAKVASEKKSLLQYK